MPVSCPAFDNHEGSGFSGGLPIRSHSRQVSASSTHRSSPLSRSFGPDDGASTDGDSPTEYPSAISPTWIKGYNRRSSANILSSSPTLSGSYITSLLSGRMAGTPSAPVAFTLHLGVTASEPCPPSLRGLPSIRLPFEARWYELNGPYTGTASILDYYASLPLAGGAVAESSSIFTSSQRRYGYRVPPKGQLQLVIANGQNTPIKHFLIPYDLQDMDFREQTICRQVWNSHTRPPVSKRETEFSAANHPESNVEPDALPSIQMKYRETLRYAVELHFVAPPQTPLYRRCPNPPKKQPANVIQSNIAGSERVTASPTLEPEHLFPFELDLDLDTMRPVVAKPPRGHGESSATANLASAKLKRQLRPRIYLSTSIRLAFAPHPPEDDEITTTTIYWGGTGFGKGGLAEASSKYFPYAIQ